MSVSARPVVGVTTCPPVSLHGVSVRYATSDDWVGNHVDLDVRPGEVLLLLGPSGCGKSTLMLTLPGLVPRSMEADLRGWVEHDGADIADLGPGSLAGTVGMVFQDPDAQVVTSTLLDEVCFGLENLMTPVGEIETRALAALSRVGLADSRAEALRSPAELSGGGRQRLAIACALALEPRVLVLDEPTANLDPAASAELYVTLAALRSPDRAIVLVEHELDDALPLADRVVVLDETGSVTHDGSPVEVLGQHARELHESGVWLPTATELALHLRLDADADTTGPLPLSFHELARRIDERPREVCTAATERDAPGGGGVRPASSAPAVELSGVTVRLGGRAVLHHVDLSVAAGDLLAVVGVNGAGKSTLARAAAGLLPVVEGTVRLCGRPLPGMGAREVGDLVGFVFQNPEHQFVTHTVADELAYGLRVRRRAADEVAAAVDRMLERFDLGRYRGVNPFLLSHGEKRRLSVATALITSPSVLVLDEPTFGQDRARAVQVAELVCELNATGIAVIVVTHDLQLVADRATQVAVMSEGRLLTVGETGAVLCDDALLGRAGLRPPPVRRFARLVAERHPSWAGVYRTGQVREVMV